MRANQDQPQNRRRKVSTHHTNGTNLTARSEVASGQTSNYHLPARVPSERAKGFALRPGTLARFAVGALALFSGVSALPSAAWASPSFPGQSRLPQAQTNKAPAQAWAGGDYYIGWKGATNDKIYYTVWNPTLGEYQFGCVGPCWAPQNYISGSWGTALTTSAPALVEYAGDLYAFWTGETGNKIYYSAYDGAWSPQHTVSGPWGNALTDKGPALTTFDGDLYVAWKGDGTGGVYYSAFNGTTWSPQVGLAAGTGHAPAVMGDSYTGSLVIAWATGSGRIDYLNCAQGAHPGSGVVCVLPLHTLPQALTDAAPALAYGSGTLLFAWKGKATHQILVRVLRQRRELHGSAVRRHSSHQPGAVARWPERPRLEGL